MKNIVLVLIFLAVNSLHSQETKTTEKPANQLETVEIKTEKSTIEHKGKRKILKNKIRPAKNLSDFIFVL